MGFPWNVALVIVFVTELPTSTEHASNAAARARVNMRGIVNDYLSADLMT
jgi:hypothetical protein